jgi:hypothetical protein
MAQPCEHIRDGAQRSENKPSIEKPSNGHKKERERHRQYPVINIILKAANIQRRICHGGNTRSLSLCLEPSEAVGDSW